MKSTKSGKDEAYGQFPIHPRVNGLLKEAGAQSEAPNIFPSWFNCFFYVPLRFFRFIPATKQKKPDLLAESRAFFLREGNP